MKNKKNLVNLVDPVEKGPVLFVPDAQLIWKFSQGIPRKINIPCDLNLLTGFRENRQKINASVFQKTISDLRWQKTDDGCQKRSEAELTSPSQLSSSAEFFPFSRLNSLTALAQYRKMAEGKIKTDADKWYLFSHSGFLSEIIPNNGI